MAMDMDIEKRLGALVRTLRLAAGMTQEALADPVGVSYQQIRKYEAGANRIAVSTMMRIAGALDTTAAEIVAESEKS